MSRMKKITKLQAILFSVQTQVRRLPSGRRPNQVSCLLALFAQEEDSRTLFQETQLPGSGPDGSRGPWERPPHHPQ